MHLACFDTRHAAMHLVEMGTLDLGRDGLSGTGDKPVGQISTRFGRKGQSL